jgi:UDP-2,3-diacylglucosamine pyrophosphatase LpxH
LILNGDIIDIWQFRKRYFPKYHLKVLKQIFALAANGTQVYYLTGNHDEMLRKFTDLTFGNITLTDKLVLELDHKKAWFFHGDIFDSSIHSAKWLAKLGGWGYDLLIMMNSMSNWFLERMGKERYSFSKKIKNSVKQAVKFIGDFENTAAELAIENKYDYVVCGHIHQPQIKAIKKGYGSCIYLNSGDWIENLTALEYQNGAWNLFQYEKDDFEKEAGDLEDDLNDLDIKALMKKVTQHEGFIPTNA